MLSIFDNGIFHKVLRERDPMSYTARAIDVFHSRLGFSLTEVHRKLNSILDHSDIVDEPTKIDKPSTLMSTALQAAGHSREQDLSGASGAR